MNRGCFTSTISRRIFSVIGIVLSVVLTVSLVSTYNKTLPTINAAVQLECSALATPQVSLENQRDGNGVPHQTKCVDPATGKISLPWTGVISAQQTVATFNAVNQIANTSGTAYAVPASSAGRYRASCYIVLTTPAGTSSTLPQCIIGWTDADSSSVEGFTFNSTATTNTLGILSPPTLSASQILQVKASTNITYNILSYASSPAGMQYALHITIEYLGQ